MRVIRPINLARLCARTVAIVAASGMALLLAAPGQAFAQAAKPATTAKTVKKTTYSASSSSARKARLARARAAARSREQARLRAVRAIREAMTPRFKMDAATGAMVPDVRAAAAVIFDPLSGQVLWGENARDQRSIASITKVMTAVVFLEDQPDLTQVVTVERGDVYAASTTYLRANERLTLDNLLHLTLIASDNAAARALARLSHGGTASFIERMNTKAAELGLESTSFTDPSGLKAENVSSAYDLSKLITYAATDDRISPIVAPIMQMAEYKVATSRRTVTIRNTNRLVVDGDVQVMGGKTGFISKAGHCLATLLRLPQSNHPVAVVVLGAGSNTGRFWETRHLFKWMSERATEFFAKDQEEQ